jgi:hypothetical protein
VIKPEINLPLSAIFFICIAVPFLFVDSLGIFTAICFSVASFCLFYRFAIIPHNKQTEITKLKNQYGTLYYRVFLSKQKKVDMEYQDLENRWTVAAVFFLVLGIIGYSVVH